MWEKDGADLFSKIELESKLESSMGWQKASISRRKLARQNIDAKELAENGEASGAVVVADMQTAGRGRRGRGWYRLQERHLHDHYAAPAVQTGEGFVLTLVMGARGVRGSGQSCFRRAVISGGRMTFVVNGKKVRGIPDGDECGAEPNPLCCDRGRHHVNQETLAPEIQETATSICIERGQQTNRAELTARVLYYFEKKLCRI